MSGWEAPLFKIPGLKAGADLRNYQYCFVKLDSSGNVVIAGTAGEKCIGVLQNKPNTGEAASVMAIGVSYVMGGATVAAGALLMTEGTTARGITAATTGSTINGFALEAGSDGALFAAYITCGHGVV